MKPSSLPLNTQTCQPGGHFLPRLYSGTCSRPGTERSWGWNEVGRTAQRLSMWQYSPKEERERECCGRRWEPFLGTWGQVWPCSLLRVRQGSNTDKETQAAGCCIPPMSRMPCALHPLPHETSQQPYKVGVTKSVVQLNLKMTCSKSLGL